MSAERPARRVPASGAAPPDPAVADSALEIQAAGRRPPLAGDSTESAIPIDLEGRRAGELAAVSLLAPGSELAERFEIRSVLGHGGFAVVYRAWDRLLRHEVALKVLRADRLTPQAVARLRREVNVAREAASPHLVRVFDLGEAGAQVFLTMELVDGETLRERLASGPLAIEETIAALRGVLVGLADLHALPVVHRDVKPGNVLLDRGGGVKLADFGLARWLDRDETRATAHEAILGTVDYMAPEQVLGGAIDARSDLYSAGMVAYEMLTGEHPFPGDSSLGTLIAHVRTRAPDVRARRREVPRWLAAVVARLLEKDPRDRFQSATEVLSALDRRRAPLTGRNWLRLRRLAAGAAVAVALVATLAAVDRLPRLARPTAGEVRLVRSGEHSIQALDTSGRVLWSRDDQSVEPATALARLRPGEPTRVLAIHEAGFEPGESERERRTLDVLDAHTGRTIEQIWLPSNAEVGQFSDFANTYGPSVYAYDLDGDGYDEVVVTFTHVPLFPSYTVVHEPRLRRNRIVFVGSGHHRPAGAFDLDGDGRRELLLTGINNRMGWTSAHVALRMVPPINVDGPMESAGTAGTSPDLQPPLERSRDPVLWYALGPKWRGAASAATFDPATGVISYPGRTDWLQLDRDGFLVDSRGSLSGLGRNAIRRDAYAALRDAEKLLAFGAPALARFDDAATAAAAAGDALLGGWIARRRAAALLRDGDLAGAARAFAQLARGELEHEIAFDAAVAHHLAGYLAHASDWYLRGLAVTGRSEVGRTVVDYLEGFVLAASERGRAREALTTLGRVSRSVPMQNDLQTYELFLRWRLGLPTTLPTADLTGAPDVARYWLLEARRQNGEGTSSLLAATADELARTTEARPMLTALRAILLADLDRPTQAWIAVQQAHTEIWAAVGHATWARGHIDLVVERYAAIARAAGEPEQAARAERELRDWAALHRKD